MNIQTIAEHSVDLDLLPEKAEVIDLGCRGFLFTDELRRRGHTVYAVDIDKFDRKDYYQIAITNMNGRVGILRFADVQATRIKEGNDVVCMDLKTFLVNIGAHSRFVDLIKIDIEGAEYEVIMSLEKPPAKQLSIEFHLHTGVYGPRGIIEMENKLLSLGYFPAKHDKTKQHGLSFNYWDSLWILK